VLDLEAELQFAKRSPIIVRLFLSWMNSYMFKCGQIGRFSSASNHLSVPKNSTGIFNDCNLDAITLH
jgi:hypothetical protein